MKKRAFGLVAATAFALAGVGTPAMAANDNAGCPTGGGWSLGQVEYVLEATDNGNYADQNGDGWVCAKLNKGQSPKYGAMSFTYKDNTNPTP